MADTLQFTAVLLMVLMVVMGMAFLGLVLADFLIRPALDAARLVWEVLS